MTPSLEGGWSLGFVGVWGRVPIYWRCSLQVLSLPSLCISPKVIPFGSWEPHVDLLSVSLRWLSPVPHPPCYIFLFYFQTLCTSLLSSPVPDTAHLYPPPLLLPGLLILHFPTSSCYFLNPGLKQPCPGLPSF